MAPKDDALHFERLSNEQRGIAWAVVRSITTSVWVTLLAMSAAWVVIAASDNQRVSLWSLLPHVGVAGLAVAMEIKSRDLEKSVP